jgi:hypothetical protein
MLSTGSSPAGLNRAEGILKGRYLPGQRLREVAVAEELELAD